MQYFYILQDATLPLLRLELVKDGINDFYRSARFNEMIQNADVTFSMWDERDVLKISNAPCEIVLSKSGECEENYIIQYKWKKRDTRNKGQYKGIITINFKDDLYQDGVSYPDGILKAPIQEELKILIK